MVQDFNVVDDSNRESLAIAVDLNLPEPRVIRVLDPRIASKGVIQSVFAWITVLSSSQWRWLVGLKSRCAAGVHPARAAYATLVHRALQSNLS